MDENVLQSITENIVDEVHPDEVLLFGSQAKGEGRASSDVDILIVLPDSEDTKWNRRKITSRLYRRLAAFPFSKDIVVYTQDEVTRWRDVPGHIIATTFREGRQLYARP